MAKFTKLRQSMVGHLEQLFVIRMDNLLESFIQEWQIISVLEQMLKLGIALIVREQTTNVAINAFIVGKDSKKYSKDKVKSLNSLIR